MLSSTGIELLKKNTFKNWCISIICSCIAVADFINMYNTKKKKIVLLTIRGQILGNVLVEWRKSCSSYCQKLEL